ncbi:MAG: type II/IV secretion system protein, partial [Thiomicrospira sp.]|nr:type II/IV secretion system protein [Thiomicrospira sp.]
MAAQQAADHKLKLAELLGLLVTDGMVSQSDADALIAERRIHREDTHPLTVISDRGWKSQTPHHRKLTLEFLTEWMAKKFGLEYFHIDPLKIDFSNLTDLMSIDYANRFAIMPIRIEDDDLVVATAEPFL